MLGILLIYSIGRYFFRLAEQFNRSKWGFAVLGVVVYIGAQVLYGIVGALIMVFSGSLNEYNEFSQTQELVLMYTGLAFGLLSVWGFYYLLKRAWEKKAALNEMDTELLDSISVREQQPDNF